MLELSVVIPVYGCAGSLRELHRRLRASIEALTSDFELIFVEDASPDGSWDVLVELAQQDPAVKAYGLSRNFGQDAAITAGLSRSQGRRVIVMDCDLQEPPEAVPELYRKALEGYEVVRTSRQTRGHSRLRRWSSRGYRRVMLERDSHPEFSNMSLLSRKVVDAFLSMRDRDREYTLVLDWLGFSQAVVTIDFTERETKSSYTMQRLIAVALNGMFFRTTVLLRVVVFTGFLVALIGAGLAAFNIIYYFVAGQPTGYTSLLVVVLLLSGLTIISVGVVGLYVGRIFEQVKYRPLFIIAREAGDPPASLPSSDGSSDPVSQSQRPGS
ncbi:MAG: glycosyltransferase family 2 protein [Actinomycetota bacterium]|nr:glycosyltransferase family 2 protein [Actinomycetota bacterium]